MVSTVHPSTLKNSLRQLPLFTQLTSDDFAACLRTFTLVNTERGQTLFHMGDEARHVFVLLDGMVKITYGNPRGDEAVVDIFQTGDIFGALFLGKYRSRIGTASPLTDSLIGRINERSFIALCEQVPQFALNFIRCQADSHRQNLARLHTLMHVDARSRLLGTLLNLSRHYCCSEKGWFHVPEMITQTDIATMACLNRTTVSLLINDLRRQQVLGGTGRKLMIYRPAVVALLEEAGLEILE
jgi:CRP-like cAMP-binding protein